MTKSFFSLAFGLVATMTCATAIGEDLIDIGLPDLAESIGEIHEMESLETEVKDSKIIPLTAECVTNASHNYGVHPDILFALLLVEGGTVGETNKGNKNNTKDLNLFQFNESNLPELEAFGITRDDVLNDGCLSAAIAARHLLRSIHGQPAPTTEMEYLSLIARYHSATPDKNLIYALKLKNAFELIYASETDGLLIKTSDQSAN